MGRLGITVSHAKRWILGHMRWVTIAGVGALGRLHCRLLGQDLDYWTCGPDSLFAGPSPHVCMELCVLVFLSGGGTLGRASFSTGGSDTGGLCTPLGDS